MRIAVEAWSPEYGGELDLGAPEEHSVEDIDTSPEARPWEPVPPSEGDLGRGRVVFIDGTRRIDARLFLSSDGQAPTPGVAGSVGIGAVVCDAPSPREGGRGAPGWWARRRAAVAEVRIERYLACGSGTEVRLTAAPGLAYGSLPVPGRSLEDAVLAVHNQMRAGEAAMAQDLAADDRLTFVDGPLAVMRPGPRAIVGFIKAHHRRYLEGDEEAVVARLGCGERTPLFCFGGVRSRYSWYLRLCEPSGAAHSWHGIVRCEAPAAIARDDAVALADASAALLPAFASSPYWDPRAPQNLVPVAGLERHLRHLLGERDLVLRQIRSAAARVSGSGA
jgi:hypothetical protein